MSCVHPLRAFRTGNKTSNGKDDFYLCNYSTVDKVDFASVKKNINLSGDLSYQVINNRYFLTDPVEIPCGTCVGCRMSKAKEWKIRNCLELQYNSEAYFVTLTYDNAHLPTTKYGEPYLSRRDITRWLKRLRQEIGSFRYFGSAEYGELHHRPHIHVIIYGHLDKSDLCGVRKWHSDAVSKTWKFGSHVVEDVTPGSIAYVSGYVEKKQLDSFFTGYPVKPFLFMSRRPGIGLGYLYDHMDSIKSTFKVYGIFDDKRAPSASKVPKSFRRVFDGMPWYESWKEAAKLAGIKMQEMYKYVYKLSERAHVDDAREDALYSKLLRFRKDTL